MLKPISIYDLSAVIRKSPYITNVAVEQNNRIRLNVIGLPESFYISIDAEKMVRLYNATPKSFLNFTLGPSGDLLTVMNSLNYFANINQYGTHRACLYN